MPIEIVVPRLGWSMDEGTFGEWLKNDGEFIENGDMIFVLEGEKASQEIESFDSGTLHIPPNAPNSGDTVAVGQLLGYLLAEGESPPGSVQSLATSAANARSQSPAPLTTGEQRVAGPAARRRARELGIDLDAVPTPDPTGRVRVEDVQLTPRPHRADAGVPPKQSRVAASPRARRRARELGIDWSNLVGSGHNGRIRERDVLRATGQSTSFSIQHSPYATLPDVPGTLHLPSRIRRTIARRMLASAQHTAPVTLTTNVNAAKLLDVRKRYNDSEMETIPTYSDILVKLVSALLPECPELNACWVNDAIYVYDEINIAIAVDTPAGLFAPVLRGTNALSIEKIAADSRRLTELVRSGKYAENDLTGGTFTITNLGMFDIDHFTPIINLPQSAILGIGRIRDAPIVTEGQVVAGKTLSLSLTFDHRVLDGGPAARWLQQLTKLIQRPEEALARVDIRPLHGKSTRVHN